MPDCEICYQVSSRFETLHDNHRVCVDCYKRLQAPTCPFCRAKIQLYIKPDLVNKYKQNDYINIQRIERRLKRNRRKNFESYDEYLQHRRKIKMRYKDARLEKFKM
jgi:hypothetical protein